MINYPSDEDRDKLWRQTQAEAEITARQQQEEADKRAVEQKVWMVLKDQLGLNNRPAELTDRIVEDLDADSLDIIEILMGVEEAFEVEIPDEEFEKVRTVGDIVNLVNEKRR